jgi:hypothetical protein
MTDDFSQYGLGGIQSPPDERDWMISDAFLMAGAEPVAVADLPRKWRNPKRASIMNQGSAPECVSFSRAREQRSYDMADSGDFQPDTHLFFQRIHGGPGGAIVRDAFIESKAHGFPVVGHPEQDALHAIKDYWKVPTKVDDTKQAMFAFGTLVLAVPWSKSWFKPDAQGVLPAFTTVSSGHAIDAEGWDDDKIAPNVGALLLPNSWGELWGVKGECWLPYDQFEAHAWEGWKATDILTPKPPAPTPVKWTLRVAAKAVVHHSHKNALGLYVMPDTARRWGPKASSAPCTAPQRVKTTKGLYITAVPVTRGVFKGRWVHLGPGVTATHS